MKTLYKVLSSLAVLLMVAVSCDMGDQKTVFEYEPAEVPEGCQAFFATDAASVNLFGSDGICNVKLKRFKKEASAVVALESTFSENAAGIFSAPANVTFPAGVDTAMVVITFDPAKLEQDSTYSATLKLKSETTPYGNSEYSFEMTYEPPMEWTVFAKGHLTESPDWWGEEEDETLYYNQISEKCRYCYISDCFDTETVAQGEEYDAQNYYFYWYSDPSDLLSDLSVLGEDKEFISVPPGFMGYIDDGALIYYSDQPNFYAGMYGYTDEIMNANGYKSIYDFYVCAQGMPFAYYDKNGGFYLADSYICDQSGEFNGYAIYVGGTQDEFIAEGYDRKFDYNDDSKFTYSLAYAGIVSSNLFSEEGEPFIWPTVIRYNADEELYYLPEYFDAEHGLAFSAPAPDEIQDGDLISDVNNEQATGINIFGYDLYVKVKGDAIRIPEKDTIAVFDLVINLFAQDTLGNVVLDFGKYKESVAALYQPASFSADDLGDGVDKADYCGEYEVLFNDYFESDLDLWSLPIYIDDAGYEFDDDYDKHEYVAIQGLTGMPSAYYDDTFYAEYDNGYLYIEAQGLGGTYYYGGEDVSSTLYLYYFDNVQDNYYTDGYMLVGFTEKDNRLVFVNYPDNEEPVNGLEFYLDGLGDLAIPYNIYEYKEEIDGVSSFVKKAEPKTKIHKRGSRPVVEKKLNLREPVKVSHKKDLSRRKVDIQLKNTLR